MKELKKIFVALAFLLLFCVGNLSAQYAKLVDSKKYTKAEMSLFNASVGYFESGDYLNANMGFSQLHSWYPSDPVFSFYCGATMVLLRTEYDKAIKYLLLARDNELNESDYYIGLAYHRKYLFSKAITYYDHYRTFITSTTKGKSPKIAGVNALMAQAVKARDIGQYSYVLKVITNSKVKRSNFHFSYGRKILGGNIVVKPDFFRLKNDKYNKDVDLVYVLDSVAFVSSYGNDMKNGLDIYYSHKTEDGWSPLKLVPGKVNSEYDEAFPFLASDGTLYFASKGHNSIGGYDIFKSEYDSNRGEWLDPQNLGFPINTPYDDFMYAIEANGGSAFFASDRSSKDGQVMVCRYIIEDEYEQIKIQTEEDLAEKAELPVTPGAEADYARILKEKQEEQKEEIKEEEEEQEVKQEADTTNMYVSTKTMLDEKLDAISKYQEYSRKLNAYSRMTSEKIRNMRAEGGADVPSSEISKMANSVVVFYDLSQKFNTVHSTAKPTLDYCGKEMDFLNKLEKGSSQYQFKLQNVNIAVEKVNAKSPLETLITEKKAERKQVEGALKRSNSTMLKGKKALRDISGKLEVNERNMQNAEDEASREHYAKEKKMLEKSMSDINSNMRTTLAEVKRLNMMIKKLDETINMLESIDEFLSSADFDESNDYEDLGASDILSLKNYINDEEKRALQEYNDMIEEDENLYSELFEYESGSEASSGNKIVADEVVSMKKYVSSTTSKLIESMEETDSLYSEKEKLEHDFDVAENDEEKKAIINQINSVQAKIDRIEKDMSPALEFEENPSVSTAIVEYNNIKQTQVGTEEWNEKVAATQELIDKSKELETMISEGGVESDEPKVKLLSKMKSDIDGQIVANVDEMRDIVLSQQIANKEIAELNNEISRIRSDGKDKSAEADVRKDVNSAAKKIDEAKRVDAASGNNLNDAENIIDAAVEKRIAILNQEYETESKVYDVLSGKYETAGRNEVRRQHADAVYYSALEDRQKAETVSDEVEKMSLLSEANKKLKSANAELMQIVAPGSKAESAEKDVLTESIVSLHEELESQKNSMAANSNQGQKVNSGENLSQNVTSGKSDGDKVQQNYDVRTLVSSVSRQENYESKIVTADTEISDIESSLATANRSDKKRLQSELDEVTTERNDNVRSLGEEKQRFYAEIDKVAQEQIANTDASAEYSNRYADYRQSLYSLTNAEQQGGNITEKLAETEKSEYALLQTIIQNVDAETKSVLQPIYDKLEEKYASHTEPVLAGVTDQSGTDVVSNTNTENTGKTTASSQLMASVSRQENYESKIVTADTEISDIESNLATANRSDRKRLQTELDEVTTERNDNVRSLGEEKQRFYAEIDKVAQEQISNTEASAEYSNRYADYRQSLYSLTNAEQQGENITEKLSETEKSEYALLQTIIPNVDAETKSVLQPIYDKLEEKYASHTEPVLAGVTDQSGTDVVSNANMDNTGKTAASSQLEASVSRQENYESKIVTADTEISDIESSLATANRSDKKRLQTELDEVTTERNGNVRSLGEEKQRFYAEIDKVAQEQIANTDASAEYSNRYADYHQSLYSLTNAEQNGENITEKLSETEKSEYALLQTIIPNVDAETKSVLLPIYSKLEEKYASSAQTVVAGVTDQSGNDVVSNANPENTGKTAASSQLMASVSRQENYESKIVTADTEISDIESSLATANRSDKKRLQTELDEVTTERNGNVRSLGEEKQRFYAEIDKVAQEQISNTEASAEYSNRYADYRQSLYSLTNAEQQGENITEKLAETEKSEYALLQTIIPNVDAETKSVLQPIYSKLEEKYASNAEPLVASGHESVSNTNTDNAGKTADSSQLKASVSRQENYESKIVTADTEISDIESSLATANRSDKKRLQTELDEVTTERNGNVRSLGEEKQRFYAEIDKVAQEQIANTEASAEYSNRYADYRQSLYSLTNAEQQGENITEKLVETEKSEYVLLQTIIPNVDAETKSVLQPIYDKLDEKYASSAQTVVAGVTNQSGTDVVSNANTDNSGKTAASSQLMASVSRQENYESKIVSADTEISDIESSLATVNRSDKKRLQTELDEVTTERNGNVRSLGEEKQRFYAEIDKVAQEQIANTDASAEYSNRYADYHQSLYSLTNAEQNGENITEKLAETEKSEYALLQTIIPNVDAETKSVLQPIYSKLEEKYASSTEPVIAGGTDQSGNDVVSNANTDNTGKTAVSSQLKASVSRQENYESKIVTADTEISDIESSLVTADRSDKKRLQSELDEVTTERNGNVRSLGEEKQRFYAEIDKVAQEQIANTDASAEYSNRYADYRQSLYSLTNAEQQGENITEKLAETEKSEYALLQTIIPNVDAETKSVLQPIYSKLEEKYASSTEPVIAGGTDQSGNDVVSNANTDNTGKTAVSSQLKASVSRQENYESKIVSADTEISDIESSLATANRNDKKRLQSELDEVTTERNGNVRSLGEEKQRFYAEIDKVAQEQIANTDASAEYSNRYADYRQSLYSLTNAEQNGENITEKLAETEKSEYALLQTIIPNVDAETKSVLQPIYSKLDEKYASPTQTVIAGGTEVKESYSQSMNLQEQMIRNIDISTSEIERLEQRKEGARKSEQRKIADDIAREESQKVDDIQKLAIEKSKFYTEINQSLEIVLPKMSDSIRKEYGKAYDSYNETLTTMKIGLGFYDMNQANKIYENAEVQEYKLLQQMKQVATGDAKKVVDDMIVRMEAKNSSLTKYRVVIKYEVTDVVENNNQTSKNVVGNNDTASNTTNNIISVNVPDSTKVTNEKVDASLVSSTRKSMSGYNADSYGIYNMPEINMGLYYRIQVVAVSIRYRMRDFNGLSLIFTEQIPNTNIVRYMTGEYYKYVSAREDLPKVRSLGFSDAFIVAYYNGKRISIAEARRLEALQNAEENEEIPVVIRHEAPADYVEPDFIAGNSMSTKNADVAGNGVEVQTNATVSANGATVAAYGSSNTDATIISGSAGEAGMTSEEASAKGMYFAVQIGVYKDKRQPWQMKNVAPIDYETMSNGYVRHTFGKFSEYEQARSAQANIRRQGITDAFVIAYIDGRKVSFAEGLEYQKQMASRLVAQSSPENAEMQSKSNDSGVENLSNVEYAPLNLTTGTEENNVSGISYYVQIGAFSKSPDPEILSVFSKVAGDKIHVKFPREGLQIYRIGVFNSYEEAQNTLAEARSFGIVDAFIVAFKGEEQISSSEAIRLQNAVRQIEGNSSETINNGSVLKSSSQNVSTTPSTATKPVVPAETLQQSTGGVEYFVQLGAFVNAPDARSLATFRSVAANSGARLSTVHNGRFTNYRVGAFKKFADVKAAVDAARSMGVTDAFVVAFYNGERIPVAEAKEKE